MGRGEQVVRTRRLEQALERPGGVVVSEFANRFGYKIRTLYRDIRALEDSGVAVINIDGRHYVERRATKRTVRKFTADDAAAVRQLRKVAVPLQQVRLGKVLDRIAATVEEEYNNEPANDKHPVLGFGGFSIKSASSIDYSHFHRMIQSIESAIHKSSALLIVYRAIGGDEVTERIIEPALLHFDEQLGSLYIIAWCRLRNARRVFAVQRLTKATVIEGEIPHRPALSSPKQLNEAFRLWREENVQTVRVRFTGIAAREIAERSWHASQTLEKFANGSVELLLQVAGLVEVKRWVLQFGVGAEVLEPSSLRAGIAEELATLSKRYR